jgi:hypothetical protein
VYLRLYNTRLLIPLLSTTTGQQQQQQQPAAAQQQQHKQRNTTNASVEDSLEESTASDAPLVGGGESPNGQEEVTCQCQFCGKYDAAFTDEKLDMHYWQSCPMLMGCAECGQVIEISALPEHLLDECQVRVRYFSANVSRKYKPCALTPQCFELCQRVLLDAYELATAITVARNGSS